MSERIKQLAKQVDACYIPRYDMWQMDTETMEKFAELIVAHATECVRDVLRDEKSDLSYAAASQVQDRIKQHFGVEE